jgi:hypothetical protein
MAERDLKTINAEYTQLCTHLGDHIFKTIEKMFSLKEESKTTPQETKETADVAKEA